MLWFPGDKEDEEEEDEAADEDEESLRGRITAIKPPLLARGSMSPHMIIVDVRSDNGDELVRK